MKDFIHWLMTTKNIVAVTARYGLFAGGVFTCAVFIAAAIKLQMAGLYFGLIFGVPIFVILAAYWYDRALKGESHE